MDAITHPPAPVNEPNLGYAPGSPERAELELELERQESREVELTATIGGDQLLTVLLWVVWLAWLLICPTSTAF